MPVSDVAIHGIERVLAPVVEQRAWGATVGVGSFITVEFGEPLPITKTRQRAHGEWNLWVTYCAWRIEQGQEVLAGSEDPRPTLKLAVQQINGLALLQVAIRAPALEATFTFEKETVLRLFPVSSEEYEHWKFFTPHGKVLIIGPGTTWSYDSAT